MMNWSEYNNQRHARIAAMQSQPTQYAYCPQCRTGREVTGLMGPSRVTLATCGHVVAK